jgi:hypothetical protein
MEARLVDAIIQLQQIATPPPPKPTSVTKIPMFQMNDERIHSILHSFVNKTLNKQAEEKEEIPNASGLTKQQEMIYATKSARYTSLPIFHNLNFLDFIYMSYFSKRSQSFKEQATF